MERKPSQRGRGGGKAGRGRSDSMNAGRGRGRGARGGAASRGRGDGRSGARGGTNARGRGNARPRSVSADAVSTGGGRGAARGAMAGGSSRGSSSRGRGRGAPRRAQSMTAQSGRGSGRGRGGRGGLGSVNEAGDNMRRQPSGRGRGGMGAKKPSMGRRDSFDGPQGADGARMRRRQSLSDLHDTGLDRATSASCRSLAKGIGNMNFKDFIGVVDGLRDAWEVIDDANEGLVANEFKKYLRDQNIDYSKNIGKVNEVCTHGAKSTGQFGGMLNVFVADPHDDSFFDCDFTAIYEEFLELAGGTGKNIEGEAFRSFVDKRHISKKMVDEARPYLTFSDFVFFFVTRHLHSVRGIDGLTEAFNRAAEKESIGGVELYRVSTEAVQDIAKGLSLGEVDVKQAAGGSLDFLGFICAMRPENAAEFRHIRINELKMSFEAFAKSNSNVLHPLTTHSLVRWLQFQVKPSDREKWASNYQSFQDVVEWIVAHDYLEVESNLNVLRWIFNSVRVDPVNSDTITAADAVSILDYIGLPHQGAKLQGDSVTFTEFVYAAAPGRYDKVLFNDIKRAFDTACNDVDSAETRKDRTLHKSEMDTVAEMLDVKNADEIPYNDDDDDIMFHEFVAWYIDNSGSSSMSINILERHFASAQQGGIITAENLEKLMRSTGASSLGSSLEVAREDHRDAEARVSKARARVEERRTAAENVRKQMASAPDDENVEDDEASAKAVYDDTVAALSQAERYLDVAEVALADAATAVSEEESKAALDGGSSTAGLKELTFEDFMAAMMRKRPAAYKATPVSELAAVFEEIIDDPEASKASSTGALVGRRSTDMTPVLSDDDLRALAKYFGLSQSLTRFACGTAGHVTFHGFLDWYAMEVKMNLAPLEAALKQVDVTETGKVDAALFRRILDTFEVELHTDEWENIIGNPENDGEEAEDNTADDGSGAKLTADLDVFMQLIYDKSDFCVPSINRGLPKDNARVLGAGLNVLKRRFDACCETDGIGLGYRASTASVLSMLRRTYGIRAPVLDRGNGKESAEDHVTFQQVVRSLAGHGHPLSAIPFNEVKMAFDEQLLKELDAQTLPAEEAFDFRDVLLPHAMLELCAHLHVAPPFDALDEDDDSTLFTFHDVVLCFSSNGAKWSIPDELRPPLADGRLEVLQQAHSEAVDTATAPKGSDEEDAAAQEGVKRAWKAVQAATISSEDVHVREKARVAAKDQGKTPGTSLSIASLRKRFDHFFFADRHADDAKSNNQTVSAASSSLGFYRLDTTVGEKLMHYLNIDGDNGAGAKEDGLTFHDVVKRVFGEAHAYASMPMNEIKVAFDESILLMNHVTEDHSKKARTMRRQSASEGINPLSFARSHVDLQGELTTASAEALCTYLGIPVPERSTASISTRFTFNDIVGSASSVSSPDQVSLNSLYRRWAAVLRSEDGSRATTRVMKVVSQETARQVVVFFRGTSSGGPVSTGLIGLRGLAANGDGVPFGEVARNVGAHAGVPHDELLVAFDEGVARSIVGGFDLPANSQLSLNTGLPISLAAELLIYLGVNPPPNWLPEAQDDRVGGGAVAVRRKQPRVSFDDIVTAAARRPHDAQQEETTLLPFNALKTRFDSMSETMPCGTRVLPTKAFKEACALFGIHVEAGTEPQTFDQLIEAVSPGKSVVGGGMVLFNELAATFDDARRRAGGVFAKHANSVSGDGGASAWRAPIEYLKEEARKHLCADEARMSLRVTVTGTSDGGSGSTAGEDEAAGSHGSFADLVLWCSMSDHESGGYEVGGVPMASGRNWNAIKRRFDSMPRYEPALSQHQSMYTTKAGLVELLVHFTGMGKEYAERLTKSVAEMDGVTFEDLANLLRRRLAEDDGGGEQGDNSGDGGDSGGLPLNELLLHFGARERIDVEEEFAASVKHYDLDRDAEEEEGWVDGSLGFHNFVAWFKSAHERCADPNWKGSVSERVISINVLKHRFQELVDTTAPFPAQVTIDVDDAVALLRVFGENSVGLVDEGTDTVTFHELVRHLIDGGSNNEVYYLQMNDLLMWFDQCDYGGEGVLNISQFQTVAHYLDIGLHDIEEAKLAESGLTFSNFICWVVFHHPEDPPDFALTTRREYNNWIPPMNSLRQRYNQLVGKDFREPTASISVADVATLAHFFGLSIEHIAMGKAEQYQALQGIPEEDREDVRFNSPDEALEYCIPPRNKKAGGGSNGEGAGKDEQVDFERFCFSLFDLTDKYTESRNLNKLKTLFEAYDKEDVGVMSQEDFNIVLKDFYLTELDKESITYVNGFVSFSEFTRVLALAPESFVEFAIKHSAKQTKNVFGFLSAICLGPRARQT